MHFKVWCSLCVRLYESSSFASQPNRSSHDVPCLSVVSHYFHATSDSSSTQSCTNGSTPTDTHNQCFEYSCAMLITASLSCAITLSCGTMC